MYMSERQVVSITEANQNFSAVARKVDERKKVVVFKNNQPKYVDRFKLTDGRWVKEEFPIP